MPSLPFSIHGFHGCKELQSSRRHFSKFTLSSSLPKEVDDNFHRKPLHTLTSPYRGSCSNWIFSGLFFMRDAKIRVSMTDTARFSFSPTLLVRHSIRLVFSFMVPFTGLSWIPIFDYFSCVFSHACCHDKHVMSTYLCFVIVDALSPLMLFYACGIFSFLIHLYLCQL